MISPETLMEANLTTSANVNGVTTDFAVKVISYLRAKEKIRTAEKAE